VPDKMMPRGADRTSAINAPRAATEIVEIDAVSRSAQSIATRLLKNRRIRLHDIAIWGLALNSFIS